MHESSFPKAGLGILVGAQEARQPLSRRREIEQLSQSMVTQTALGGASHSSACSNGGSQGRPIPCRPPRVALELELHMMRESFAAEQRQCQQVAAATAAQIKDLELQLRFERRARQDAEANFIQAHQQLSHVVDPKNVSIGKYPLLARLAHERESRRNLCQRAVSRLLKCQLARVWDTLAAFVAGRKQRRRRLRHAVIRMHKRELAWAFAGLHHEVTRLVAARQGRYRALRAAGARWLNKILAQALMGWRQHHLNAVRLTHLTCRVLRHWMHRTLSSAWLIWYKTDMYMTVQD